MTRHDESWSMKRYKIYKFDLNSLYDTVIREDVVVASTDSLSEAAKIMKDTQDHVTAAWIVDSQTGMRLTLENFVTKG